MIDARLQFGPYDGIEGEVHEPVPITLDVKTCYGCGCGRPVHYRTGQPDEHPPHGYARYDLICIDEDGALYQHADTLDPFVQALIAETVNA